MTQSALPDLSLEQYEQYNPIMRVQLGDRSLVYAVPNRMCAWRVQTLLSKEPATIDWLNALPVGTNLLDVGANVGMYSIYASVLRGARVFAFEPEAQNYATLCRNIMLNRVQDRVTAWCAALSDEERFDRIHVSDPTAGSSSHSFGEARDAFLREATFPFTQGSFATTVDKLIAAGVMAAPEHMKIDVDGFEHKVIVGSAELLRGSVLRSVLIEVNPALAQHRWIIEHLESCGFRYDPDQVAKSRRPDGQFQGLAEYVFRR